MAMYRCRVADASGKISEIVRESTTQDSLVRQLSAKGFSPIKITEETGGADSAGHKRIPLKTIIDFTQTMSILITSGLTLKDALGVAKTIFTRGREHVLISHISERLGKGTSFSAILEEMGDTFPPLYRGLVRIGEKIGSLDNIFERLAAYLTGNKKLGEKIIGALVYPLLILCIIVVGAVVMTFFVFPMISTVFTQLGSTEALTIQGRMEFFNVIMAGIAALVLIFTTAGMTMAILRKQGGAIGISVDTFILKIPVLGKSTLYTECTNFLFAMDTLTGSGYSVEEALLEASHVLKNSALKKAVGRIRDRIIRGDALSDAFYEQKLFPQRIAQWIVIGERSGKVEQVFSQLSKYYQDEIDKWSTRLASWIEPFMIVAIGIFLIIFVILFLLPIFSMSGNVFRSIK